MTAVLQSNGCAVSREVVSRYPVRIERPVVSVFGLPISAMTFGDVLDAIDHRIAARIPGYIITANLNYAMLTARDSTLATVNRNAAFLLADGMPLVWASHWHSDQIPERIAGSDLVPALCDRAAKRGYRVFFLGGAAGVAEEAARRLQTRQPNLRIVGIESPQLSELSYGREQRLIRAIRESKPDLLFASLGQPRGEKWLARHYRELDVPVCMQVGATVDFLAGRVKRAPKWTQRMGLEWAYRLSLEPLRLGPRYFRNAAFLIGVLARGLQSRMCGRTESSSRTS